MIDMKAGPAYRRAGYSERGADQAAYKLLRCAQVETEIRRLKEARAKKAILSSDQTLAGFSTMGHIDIREFYDPVTNELRPISEWTPEMGQQVVRIETVRANVTAGDGHQDTIHRVWFVDRAKGLEGMAKYHRLANPTVDVHHIHEITLALRAARPRIVKAAEERAAFRAKHPELLEKNPGRHGPRDAHVLEGEIVNSTTVASSLSDGPVSS